MAVTNEEWLQRLNNSVVEMSYKLPGQDSNLEKQDQNLL